MIEGEGWVRVPEAAAPTRAAGLERRRLVGAVLASVALAACGGGGGSGEDVDASSGGAGPGLQAGQRKVQRSVTETRRAFRGRASRSSVRMAPA